MNNKRLNYLDEVVSKYNIKHDKVNKIIDSYSYNRK